MARQSQKAAGTSTSGTRPGVHWSSRDDSNDIAIVGLAGRYPMARDVGQLWQNLRSGKDCVTEVPAQRWDHARYFDPTERRPGTTRCNWGGFIEGVDTFDSLLFGIAPREAETMDPQERLFLQCAYHAMEDAGYRPRDSQRAGHDSSTDGDVGVYVGAMYQEYQFHGLHEEQHGRSSALIGNLGNIANRVSYVLNLHGPSIALDTMCSSSLTAIHLACNDLLSGETRMAIAGGVNLSIHPNKYVALARGRFASSRRECRSFGLDGDGYVPGEGVGAVLLKRLRQATLDGDHIYGVILGTAINHGGRANGYTGPSPQAQAAVIARALDRARVSPREVSYIEAHGSGTALGDPIEVEGLRRVFETDGVARQSCPIGSVKSNLGHCESAAGIAGLTKVLLQMRHRELVPSLHATPLNPNIDFSQSAFRVQVERCQWERPRIQYGARRREIPRIAGVSSFGAGGSNAHLIVQEYVRPLQAAKRKAARDTAAPKPVAIVLSARDEQRLLKRVRLLRDALQGAPPGEHDLESIAYTLQTGREEMACRLAYVVESVADLVAKLDIFLATPGDPGDGYFGKVKASATASSADPNESVKEPCDYGPILERWVSGAIIDWNKLYAGVPQRVSLPGYPFAEERHWVGAGLGLLARADAPITDQPDAERPAVSQTDEAASERLRLEEPPKSDLKASAIQYLTATLATTLKIPAERLDPGLSLEDYGLDSVASLDLMDELSEKIGPLPITLLITHDTVYSLADYLLENHGAQMKASLSGTSGAQRAALPALTIAEPPSKPPGLAVATVPCDSRSVTCLKAVPRPVARLIVFPCFGFGKSAYSWLTQLPCEAEIWFAGTTKAQSWTQLVEGLTAGVEGLFDVPVVVWGHSMGAIAAFEVLAELERRAALVAHSLVISGCVAPRRFQLVRRSEALRALSMTMTDHELEQHLISARLILPRSRSAPTIDAAGLRNDLQLLKSYRARAARRLSIPFHLVHATHDNLVRSAKTLSQWNEVTSATCTVTEVTGTHLMVIDPPRGLTEVLATTCRAASERNHASAITQREVRSEAYDG